jgi:LmbE family N-acetylglucosaminyl deacetylase
MGISVTDPAASSQARTATILAKWATIRQGELRRACEHLGVSHLELLGYHDSGMAGWVRILEAVEQRITTIIDVSQVVDRKRTALHAHASQIGSSLAGKLPASQFSYAFGAESYIRACGIRATSTPEDDLFAGLRKPSQEET